MIVIDASVMIDLLIGRRGMDVIGPALLQRRPWNVPHLIDLEVSQVLRRLARTEKISGQRAEAAVALFLQTPVIRHSHLPLFSRIWALRHTITAYDAAYVALAEALAAPLITRDAKLASSHDHTAAIELV